MAIVYNNGQAYSDNRAENAAFQAKQPKAAPRPVVVRRPKRVDYGTPSREGIDSAQADMSSFLHDYQDPRSTGRFSDLLGSASSTLARGTEEADRVAREASARRGYVGGFSEAGEMAARTNQRELARVGFDAANTVATDSANLYTGAAGRYSDLVKEYDAQLGEGDRAFGNAMLTRSGQMAENANTFREQQERTRQFDTTTVEGRRQFDLSFVEDQRQFNAQAAANKREFDITTAARRREFDLETTQGQKEFALDLAQRQQEFAASKAEQQRQFDAEQKLRREENTAGTTAANLAAWNAYNASIGRSPGGAPPPGWEPPLGIDQGGIPRR